MTRSVKDSFLDLERHRQILEENIAKLRKALQHWQTWEAEYEGLKEEILAHPRPNREELAAIGQGYEGELVNSKEISDILGGKSPRTAEQVINILEKRIDYVHQNVETVEKQVQNAENRLAAATIISNPDVRNEDGLPMTEIFEELDEEGNIISSHTTTPGSAAPQLLEALKKAGVTDLPDDTPAAPDVDASVPESEKKVPSASRKEPASNDTTSSIGSDPKATTTPSSSYSVSSKKAVRFSEDTESQAESQATFQRSANSYRVESIMNEAKKLDKAPKEPPIIPTDESPDDAKLRKEMIQYGMSEVGSVVAELDIEEGSDWSGEDYDMDETTSTDDEDEFGRSTRSVIDDDLRQRMRELEERLGVTSMHNAGKNPDRYDVVKEGIGRITIKGDDKPEISTAVKEPAQTPEATAPESKSEAGSIISGKKSVRFSESLDISPAPQPPEQLPSSSTKSKQKLPPPIADIVERKAPTQSVDEPTPKRQSRFKSARASNILNGPLATPNSAQPSPSLPLFPASSKASGVTSKSIQFAPVENESRAVPTGPEGRTLATTIIEHEPSESSAVLEPDELDPHLLHQEVAVEYHRRRNQMIQKQGGFLQKEESEIVPLEEEEGGPKKLSRFKAARLARS